MLCVYLDVNARGGLDNVQLMVKSQFIVELKHAMPITPHANGEPLLKQSFSFPVCNDSACCLVCKRRRDGSALTSKVSSNLLNDDAYQCVCAGNCVFHLDE